MSDAVQFGKVELGALFVNLLLTNILVLFAVTAIATDRGVDAEAVHLLFNITLAVLMVSLLLGTVGRPLIETLRDGIARIRADTHNE